jgi:type IV secretory pathway TraG/TraD family ATPase VirD4
LYSHFGSRGITLTTILQSYKQGTRVWGEAGMDTLWGAATIKIIGSGTDDAKFAEDLSRLIGDHDVPVTAYNHTRDSISESVSLRRQRILPPEDIRALPRGHALLLATGVKPAMLTLLPWYDSPHAARIQAAITAATKTATTNAHYHSNLARQLRDE